MSANGSHVNDSSPKDEIVKIGQKEQNTAVFSGTKDITSLPDPDKWGRWQSQSRKGRRAWLVGSGQGMLMWGSHCRWKGHLWLEKGPVNSGAAW